MSLRLRRTEGGRAEIGCLNVRADAAAACVLPPFVSSSHLAECQSPTSLPELISRSLFSLQRERLSSRITAPHDYVNLRQRALRNAGVSGSPPPPSRPLSIALVASQSTVLPTMAPRPHPSASLLEQLINNVATSFPPLPFPVLSCLFTSRLKT